MAGDPKPLTKEERAWLVADVGVSETSDDVRLETHPEPYTDVVLRGEATVRTLEAENAQLRRWATVQDITEMMAMYRNLEAERNRLREALLDVAHGCESLAGAITVANRGLSPPLEEKPE